MILEPCNTFVIDTELEFNHYSYYDTYLYYGGGV
jgi:hypothetical protein